MLLGSVPSPPRKPKSSISTQSARQNTTRATTVRRSSQPDARPPATRPAPMAASARTANRVTETPCAAGADAPAEGFAESLEDQPPGGAGQAGQPGPGPSRRGDQPGANPDRDPDDGCARLDRVIRPGCPGQVHQVLHPRRRGPGRGLDDLSGEPDGHGRRGRQQPVKDPAGAESEPHQVAPDGLVP